MGKPLLIHAGFDAHGDYDALLQKAPDLKLILAHAGFPLYFDTRLFPDREIQKKLLGENFSKLIQN
jgi:hypothetical protein